MQVLFDIGAVLLLIPIFDSYVYPCLRSAGVVITPLRKIGAGYVFAALAMVFDLKSFNVSF